jgi:transcription-repair coupling factor (superfamily II helicase)
MYKRIAMIETEDEKLDVIDELTDRYGEVPEAVNSLLAVAQIKAQCHKVYITAVSLMPTGSNEIKLRLAMYNEAPLKTELLDEFINDHATVELKGTDKPYFTLTIKKGTKKLSVKEEETLMIAKLKEFLEWMKELV